MMMNGGMYFAGNQMPPAKRFRGGGGNPRHIPGAVWDGSTGEIRYDNAHTAHQAVEQLNGTVLKGSLLSLGLCPSSKDSTKIAISGLPAGLEMEELRDHFAPLGNVVHCNIRGGKRSGPKLKGEVRFNTAQEAATAMSMLQGKELEAGGSITISVDPDNADSGKLIITDIPAGTHWKDLKDHFAKTGLPVAFCNVVDPANSTPCFAEVRYESLEHSQTAMKSLNGSSLLGATIFIQSMPGSSDGTKLMVQGLAPGTQWQEVKEHFGQIGTVAFCQVNGGKGKGGKGGMKGGMMPMMPMMPMMGKGMKGGMMGGMMGGCGKGGQRASNGMSQQQAQALVAQARQQGQVAVAVMGANGWTISYPGGGAAGGCQGSSSGSGMWGM